MTGRVSLDDGSRPAVIGHTFKIDAILSNAQILTFCGADQRNTRLYVAGFDPQGGADSEVGHGPNAECSNDTRPLGQLRFLAARTGLQKLFLSTSSVMPIPSSQTMSRPVSTVISILRSAIAIPCAVQRMSMAS